MPLDFAITLRERLPDRVRVTVRLAPREQDAVEGVAVELRSRTGERVGPRHVLPVSGRLIGPMETLLELRAPDVVPRGAKVVGAVYLAEGQLEATCPTDPCTHLETFMRGAVSVPAEGATWLPEDLDADERARLVGLFPWIDGFRPCCRDQEAAVRVLDEIPRIEDVIADVQCELGLDDECAEWLRDLLSEDDTACG